MEAVYAHTRPGLKFYVIQALELHGCMFPGSPLLHPDSD